MEKEQNILFNPQPSVFDSSVVVSNGTTFTVDNRTLISAAPVTDVVVQNDAMSKCISITMQRYFDNIDLSLKQINVIYSNAYGQSGTSVIGQSSIQETTDTIIISWWLPSEIAAAAGTVEFQMRFFDLDNTGKVTYMWQTKITTFNVERSIEALQQAYANTYDIERAFELANRDNVTWTSILDYNVPINIKNRTCENIPTDLVLKGDTNSQALSFVIPRFLDKVDLATKVITIKYVNALGLSDRSRAINTIIDTDTITFTWLINSRFTIESGSGLFAVEILGYNFPDGRPVPPVVQPEDLPYFYVWQTKPVTVVIEKSLYVDGSIPMPTPDWEARWQVESDAKLAKAQASADAAKASENAAKASENAALASKNAAATSATASANSASAALTSQNAAKASETAALASKNSAEMWATGGTSGTPSSTNNSKYFCEQASSMTGNKGYYPTAAALLSAYPNNISNPTSRNGWVAFVGETDCQWGWNSGLNKWSSAADNIGRTKVDKSDIINDLTSTFTDKPLSAAMGKELKRLIDTKTITVVNNLTSTSTTDPLSAAMGKKLQDEKAPKANPTFTGTVSGITKAMVGLGNVSNEAAVNNLISTSTTAPLSANMGKWLNEKKCHAYSSEYAFGGNSSEITTEQFLDLLVSLKAFDQPMWVARGSWYYAGNQIISDTGCGKINLAGAVVLANGASRNQCTIRIITPTTSSGGVANAEFIYVNNGSEYIPGWRKVSSPVNSLTSTSAFDPLSAAQGKVLSEGKLDKNSVVNNLTTTTTTVPLSAAQGKVLADRTRNLDSDGSGIVVSGQLTRSGANANYGIIYKGTSFSTPSTWQDGDLYIVYK